jgi:hypothetical protein
LVTLKKAITTQNQKMYLRLIGIIASGPIIGYTVARFFSYAINRIMKKYDNIGIDCDKCRYKSLMEHSYFRINFRCNCVPLYIKFLRLSGDVIRGMAYNFAPLRRQLRNDIRVVGIMTSPFISMGFWYCYTNPNVTFIDMIVTSGLSYLFLEILCGSCHKSVMKSIFWMLFGCLVGATIKFGVIFTKYFERL